MAPKVVEPLLQLLDVALQIAQHPAPDLRKSGTPSPTADSPRHAYASQSPQRVYSVVRRRSSSGAVRTPRSNSGSNRVIRPAGDTKADTPVFAARAIVMRCSTARSGNIPRCCQGPLVSPNHASLVILLMKPAPATTKSRNSSGKITS